MRPPVRRTAPLLTGVLSFSTLIFLAHPAAAQFGAQGGLGLGQSWPLQGGQGPSAGGVPRGLPNSRVGGVSGGITAPGLFPNAYGDYPTQYGSPFGNRGYYGGYRPQGGYGGVVRNYQVPGQFFGGSARPSAGDAATGGVTGGDMRSLDISPSDRSGTPNRPASTGRGATGFLSAPPTVAVNPNGTTPNNGNGVGTYYSPEYYGSTTFFTGGPPLLGGYYYGGYCDSPDGDDTYPSVYGVYDGFPGYITSAGAGVTFYSQAPALVYADAPQPFYPPVYTVTYNQNNYYVTNEDSADDIAQGGEAAQSAVKKAYPADSYQAAFADIERSWQNGDVSLLKKHLRSDDTKVSVSLKSAYKYSLNSSDFAQITRDAFDRLNTVSFKFTALQKAKNGDVTAYGTHVYQPEGGVADGSVVPFDADNAGAASADDGDTGAADAKTVYVSYTLRHGDNGWYVTAIDSSTEPLVKAAE